MKSLVQIQTDASQNFFLRYVNSLCMSLWSVPEEKLALSNEGVESLVYTLAKMHFDDVKKRSYKLGGKP